MFVNTGVQSRCIEVEGREAQYMKWTAGACIKEEKERRGEGGDREGGRHNFYINTPSVYHYIY
jgi:hypothetical protein